MPEPVSALKKGELSCSGVSPTSERAFSIVSSESVIEEWERADASILCASSKIRIISSGSRSSHLSRVIKISALST